MALQVWLPLNGNFINNGLAQFDDFALPSGASWSAGKLGNNLNISNASTRRTINKLNNLKEFSISLWYKMEPDKTYTQWRDVIMVTDSINEFRLETVNTAGTATSWYGYGMNASGTGHIAVTTGVWYHDTVVVSGRTIKRYINGSLYSTTTSENDCQLAGDLRLGDTGMYCQIADVRIYDYCLSKREIKEISKGLVAHYMLSKPDNSNYFLNSNFYNSTTSWYGVNSSSPRIETKDGHKCITGAKGTTNNICGQTLSGYNYVANSQVTFTISADVYVEETGTFGIGNWISTTEASGWQGMSFSEIWHTPNVLSVGWNHVSVTHKNATKQYNGSIITAFAYTGTTYWMTNVKFEFGDKETPWLPNSSDSIYSSLGYGSNIEYDCSGYQNNGTRTNVTTTSDTPRNTSSSVFNGSNSYIACGRGGMVRDEITLSLWAYSDDWSRYTSNECMLSCTEGGGWSVAKNTNGNLTIYMGTGTSSNSYIVVGYALTNMKTGWNYIVSTYDGLSSKLYVNGVMVTSKTQYSTKTPIYYHSSNGIFIGAEASGNQTTPISGDKFPGYLSDLRIYATALSDTDILELYNAPINFNKHSTMVQGEFLEK